MSLVAVLCKFLVDVIISYGGPLGIQYLMFSFYVNISKWSLLNVCSSVAREDMAEPFCSRMP